MSVGQSIAPVRIALVLRRFGDGRLLTVLPWQFAPSLRVGNNRFWIHSDPRPHLPPTAKIVSAPWGYGVLCTEQKGREI